MVVCLNPIAVTYTSDIAPVLIKDFFTLKRVCEMIITCGYFFGLKLPLLGF